ALRSVTYSNSSDAPDTTPRTISFVVNDGIAAGNTSSKTVSVIGVNDAPEVFTTLGSVTFTEGAAPTVVDSGISLTDLDNTTLASATVSISGAFHEAQDLLAFSSDSTMGNIIASYDAVTGVLALTSANATATLGQWQSALRSATYSNSSDAPDTTPRTISFVVSDGIAAGNTSSKTVSVISVNDAPMVTLPATQATSQGAELILDAVHRNGIQISDVDAGSNRVHVTLTATHGVLSLSAFAALNLNFLEGSSGINDVKIVMTGTLVDINAALNGLKYAPTAGYSGVASISVVVDDLGNTGGVAQTTSQTLDVNISSPPTPPVTPPAVPVFVDGVPVTTTTAVTSHGETINSVTIGLVTDSRQDDGGAANTADINISTSGQTTLLSAHLPVGFGMKAVGGGSNTAYNSADTLKAAIDAVTTNNDQAHQDFKGQSFLEKLAADSSLLVQTITPLTSTAALAQPLVLTGSANSTQHTALVIDAGQTNSHATLELNKVDFAAVVGQATVQGNTIGQVLVGDDGIQTFIVNASDSQVFAGGGNDTLQITSFSAASNTTLQGGQGDDTVQFENDRSMYNIEQHAGYAIVSNKNDPGQHVKVVNVESLSFADGSVSIETTGQQIILATLYQSVLGRQADVEGFEFWSNMTGDGKNSLGQTALAMAQSVESATDGFAMNGQSSHDVAVLYKAILNREPDAAGLAFWVQQKDQGASMAMLASAFVVSTELVGQYKAPASWDFVA
ncbi:DUF4214 domain-containing protein, partial [Pseudomonas sp. CCI1.2]|uniref:DUF4214 domain-containing protein n=1 Tax=Pseudomonas sp. CCI1.2 TaxID=3048614 RepID=UPI002B22AC4E